MLFSLVVALCLISISIVPNTDACGVPQITPSPPLPLPGALIVGGETATPGSWPWQANLRSKSGDYQFCGGSLIDEQFILTAAHCYYRALPMDQEVGLGFHHVNGDGDAGTVMVDVQTIILHEDYKSRTLENDVCLLKLSTPVTMTDRISPVCLPAAAPFDGSAVHITGWGDTENTTPDRNLLQEATVKIIDRKTCNQRGWYNGEILDGMVCAGYGQGGIDTCQGDSGGPLVQSDASGTYVIHGITSWGYGCADAKNPGVYAEVAYYKDWIATNMAANRD